MYKRQPHLTSYLADDHEIVAMGLATILLKIESIKEVKIFKNGKTLFDYCQEKCPDIVFLDYEMPVLDGVTTLVNLKNKFPNLPVLMLTMVNEKKIIEDCISKGASGYLNKNCTMTELEDAIAACMNGNIYYSREALVTLSGVSTVSPFETKNSAQLSAREMEVLKLLCDGLSPKEIAQQLFLSPRTTETHKKNIMEKLEVNSIAKLISVALRSKIITD